MFLNILVTRISFIRVPSTSRIELDFRTVDLYTYQSGRIVGGPWAELATKSILLKYRELLNVEYYFNELKLDK